jgi:RNA polymerase sigma-70 factor, ECF subfamily
MSGEHDVATRVQIDRIYRAESRRVFATLLRLLGDFDLAEEALHEAFTAAVQQWPLNGVPDCPRAWLVTVGRLRGIDALRRRRSADRGAAEVRHTSELEGVVSQTWPPPSALEQGELADDQLRLLFTCCRPELASDAQVALTLRELCGLTTEEIARAYLSKPSAIAQRIVRAKQRLRERRVPYEVPEASELAERSAQVMRVIYLVFNEGYAASSGKERVRVDLCAEAIRLARLLVELLPHPEADGLLALLLLQDARRESRTSPAGDIVLLADQDRKLWDRERIAEGTQLVERSFRTGRAGSYALQAAIAAVYSESIDGSPIDWAQIVALHDVLGRVAPSPVAQLARAIAIGERDGPAAGLALVEAILEQGALDDYVPAHAARADLCRRLARTEDALASLRRARELAQQEPEQRYFQSQISRLESKSEE